jgi:hypothetical protein
MSDSAIDEGWRLKLGHGALRFNYNTKKNFSNDFAAMV